MRDPVYERAMEFAKNHMKTNRHIGISNIYVIQSIRPDGTVTDEKYGMNLLTDYGMTKYFLKSGSSYNSFPTNLYIGNGSGSITVASKSLNTPITTTAATVSISTINYAYPLYYFADNDNPLITVTARYRQMYFDTTISGVSGDVEITEYGIGTSAVYSEQNDTGLWTHSWVYDNLGNRSSVTKRDGERLYFTVYFCLSYTPGMIDDAWSNGKHVAITTMHRFFNNMCESNVYTFKRNSSFTSRTKVNTNSAFDPDTHSITTYTNLSAGGFQITNATGDANEYMDGIISHTTGFMFAERETATTPEAVDTILPFYVESDLISDDSLTKNFGASGKKPFTQVDITKSYTYDHKTNGYTSEESFVQTANKWYTETLLSANSGGTNIAPIPIWYNTNNTITQMYLYMNIKTDDPIIAIKGALATVYATDTYWDSSSWELITNLGEVPVALQHKKYWITPNNTVSLNPVRGNPVYRPNDTPGGTYAFTTGYPTEWSMTVGGSVTNASDVFIIGNYIYKTDNLSRQSIRSLTNTTSDDRYNILNGWIFYVGHASGYDKYLYNIKWDTVNNVWIADSLDATTINANITAPYSYHITYSDTTVMIINPTSKDAIVYNGTTAMDLGQVVVGCMLQGTNPSGSTYGAGAIVKSGADHTIEYYTDFATGTPTATFTIPSAVGAPSMMFGYDKWIYFTNGSSYMYVVDVTTGVISACDNYIPSGSVTANQYFEQTSVETGVVVYQRNKYHTQYAFAFVSDNPTTRISLSDLDPGTSSRNNYVQYSLRKWNDTLILGYSCSYSSSVVTAIYDLSYFIGTGTRPTYFSRTHSTPYVFFGRSLIYQNTKMMLVNYVAHRIVGTTYTITALAHTKQINSKEWNVQYTNNPTWQGIPPGQQQ